MERVFSVELLVARACLHEHEGILRKGNCKTAPTDSHAETLQANFWMASSHYTFGKGFTQRYFVLEWSGGIGFWTNWCVANFEKSVYHNNYFMGCRADLIKEGREL